MALRLSYSRRTVERQEHSRRNTLSPGLCVFQSYSLNMAVEGQEHSSLATVDMQGHSVPRFSAFPVLQSCDCERQEHSSLTTVYVHGRRTTVYVQSSSLTTVVVQGHTVSQLSALPALQSYDCRGTGTLSPEPLARSFQHSQSFLL